MMASDIVIVYIRVGLKHWKELARGKMDYMLGLLGENMVLFLDRNIATLKRLDIGIVIDALANLVELPAELFFVNLLWVGVTHDVKLSIRVT